MSEKKYVLKHGWGTISCLGAACLFVAIGMLLIARVASPWDNRGETVMFLLCLIFFFTVPVIAALEVIRSRVIITDESISVQTPWPWRSHGKIRWNEIQKVGYSAVRESFILTATNGRRLPISEHFPNIGYLVTLFKERLDPSIYEEAKTSSEQNKKGYFT